MLPGPTSIYKCPHCDNLLSRGSIYSGNAFHSELYSDGKRVNDMQPVFPILLKCSKCSTIFWLENAEKVGSFEWGECDNEAWKKAQKAEFLSIEDNFLALNQKVFTNDNEEFLIRRELIWGFNDRVRNGGELFQNGSEKTLWVDNINQTFRLLDEKDLNQRIVIADLYRSLGKFDLSMKLLESIKEPELQWVTAAFKKECENGNKLVFLLSS